MRDVARALERVGSPKGVRARGLGRTCEDVEIGGEHGAQRASFTTGICSCVRSTAQVDSQYAAT
jgi:hypothetical protein